MSFHEDMFHETKRERLRNVFPSTKSDVLRMLKKGLAEQQKQYYEITKLMSELEKKNMNKERRMLFDILRTTESNELRMSIIEGILTGKMAKDLE